MTAVRGDNSEVTASKNKPKTTNKTGKRQTTDSKPVNQETRIRELLHGVIGGASGLGALLAVDANAYVGLCPR